MEQDQKNKQNYASDFIDSKSHARAFMEDPVVDNLLSTVVALGSELWVNRRRQLVVEKILEAKGIINLDEIESYDPDEKVRAQWEAFRDEFVDRVYSLLVHDAKSMNKQDK